MHLVFGSLLKLCGRSVVYFTVIVLPVCNGYDYFLCCIMIASLGYKTCMQLRGVSVLELDQV